MNALKNFLLTAVLFLIITAAFPQARIQVIHNSADASLEMMDIWLDQTLIADNMKFRTATPFMDAPAGVQVTIAVANADSQNPNDPLWSHTYTFTDGEAYVLVAEGIITAAGYNPPTPFDMAVFTGAEEIAGQSDKIDMMSQHSSTDAPAIDIYETGVGLGRLVNNLSYSNFDPYQELSTNDYIFEVRDAENSTVIASYLATFQEFGFKGKAITVLASGFLHPENNSGGPAFGLWVAPAEGGHMVELPVFNPLARVQFINNSADAAASVVDVWLDQTLLIDNFNFRTASAFLDIPAEREITIAFASADSQNPDTPLWSHTYTLTTDQTYVMVAEGILSSSGYNPPIPFDITVYDQAVESAGNPVKNDILFEHGSTDTPVFDIYEIKAGLGLLVDNLAYGQFSGYKELETQDYILELRDESGTNKIAAFKLPLNEWGVTGNASTVVASGFLQPGNNSNGPALGLWMASAAGGSLYELPVYDPKARVQFIHNSADESASVMDVWLDNDLILDNFAFRTASTFINVPAGQEFTLAIKGPDSQNPDNPLWSHTYTLTEDEKYIFVADGIISSSGYDPATPFSIEVYPNAREEANNNGMTDMLMHHGSTDTPTIDIVEVGIGLGLMIDNLQYSQYAGYFGMATVNYIFQVRDETGMTKIGAFQAPFATMGLQGDALTVLASGFMEPDNNSGGPEFGLYLAKATGGELIKLPVYAPVAKVQVINNSADTAASVVDVWMNTTMIADNLNFRAATPFINLPANEQINITICPPDSQDPYSPLYFHSYTLTEGETYVMVAEGIASASGFEPPRPFDIALYTGARLTSNISGRTDMLFENASTDAPNFDVVEVGLGAGTLLSGLAYGNYSSYVELPTINYVFEVRDASNSNLIGTFRAPLQTEGLENLAVTIVASGFIDPSVNSNGEPFGLYAAVPTGGPMIELQKYVPSALVQFIHNSADAAVSTVDVWLNDELLIDNFAYRTATPFIYIPANNQITISVCGPDSQDPSNPLWTSNYTLTEDANYIMVADGIISPSGYDPAPAFTLSVYDGASLEAGVATNTDVLFYHGATDAPTGDIVSDAQVTLVDNLSYGAFDGYVELATLDYWINLTDETGTTNIGRFYIMLSGLNLTGKTATLLLSGFVDPSVNSNGPYLSMLIVMVDGTTSFIYSTLGIDEPAIDPASLNVFPNPATDALNISFDLKNNSNARVEMIDVTGRMVSSSDFGKLNKGTYNEKINIDNLTPGMYMLKIITGENQISKKVVIR
jgi:hypothetical protein